MSQKILNDNNDIVINSRVRLARNIYGFTFPEWASIDELAQIKSISKKAITELGRSFRYKELAGLKDHEKNLLVAGNILSSQFIDGDPGARAFALGSKKVSIMINEEDHLRLSVQKEADDLETCWEIIDNIDTKISENVEYAFSNENGFATACPSNVGTGMRASVMLHLPALCLDDSISSLITNLTDGHITVRGLSGEGSVALGHIFQISNLNTLGISEPETLAYLKKVSQTIIKKELLARKNLLKREKLNLTDKVRRAIGILEYACFISYEEALSYLSLISLGQRLGLEKETKELKNMATLSKQLSDSYLQKSTKTKDVDIVRAGKVRAIINKG